MQNYTRSTIKYYLNALRGYRALALLMFVGVAMGSAGGVVVPLYLKEFFDTLVTNGNTATTATILIKIITIIAGIELIRWAGFRIGNFVNVYLQANIMKKLANLCFQNLHKHSTNFFNDNFVGSLVKRVNWFIRAYEAVQDRFLWNIVPLVVDITLVVVILMFTHKSLAIIVIVWTIIFLLFNWALTRYKFKYDVEKNEEISKATGILADTITNNSNVKLFVGYNRETDKFSNQQEKVRKLRVFTWNLGNVFEAVQGFMVIALEITTFYVGVKLWQKGLFTVGDFVLIQAYVIVVFHKIWDFGRVIRDMYERFADAAEMSEILDTPHEIKDTPTAKNLIITKGEIEFKEVDFYYHQTRSIFSKLNLTIKSKEKIALVGPSGSGKSTIIKLLLRVHDLTAGKILIDGQQISKVKMDSLWKNLSLVPQDPILFHRTLMENIRYGKFGASDKEVVKAAKLARCHNFIKDFPNQYNTYVGERGVKLSGGERQRVAIARAILRNAPILLLDEATSSLDSESELLIQEALENLMKDKTVIVVAHRLSTIMKMDRILVVDNGEVVEEGTHNDLIKKNSGLYKGLWKIQAGGFIS